MKCYWGTNNTMKIHSKLWYPHPLLFTNEKDVKHPQSIVHDNGLLLSVYEFLGKMSFSKSCIGTTLSFSRLLDNLFHCMRQEHYSNLTWVSQVIVKIWRTSYLCISAFENCLFNKLNHLRTIRAVCTQILQEKIKEYLPLQVVFISKMKGDNTQL